jgi:hypothetical protein
MKIDPEDLEMLAAIRNARSLAECDGIIMLPAKDLKLLLETLDLFTAEMDRICGLAEPETKVIKELN